MPRVHPFHPLALSLLPSVAVAVGGVGMIGGMGGMGGCQSKTLSESATHGVEQSDLKSGPAVIGAESAGGLEAATWITSADDPTLARVLNPYVENLVPLSSRMQQLWEGHGFRIIAVPIDDIDGVIRELKSSGSSQRQWLGQSYTWTEIVRGGDMPSGQTVALDAERIRLSPGYVRLLVRSWVEPVPVSAADSSGPAATLSIEILPQHVEQRIISRQSDPLGVGAPRIAAEDQGLLFSRLYTRMSVPGGTAYILLAERPGVQWKAVSPAPLASSAPASEDPAAASAQAPLPASDLAPPLAEALPLPERPTPRIGEVVRSEKPRSGANSGKPAPRNTAAGPSGPPAPVIPTLGEAMLAGAAPGVRQDADDDAPPRSRSRALVVLIPRVPEEFRMLAKPAR